MAYSEVVIKRVFRFQIQLLPAKSYILYCVLCILFSKNSVLCKHTKDSFFEQKNCLVNELSLVEYFLLQIISLNLKLFILN